jgi:hypothetical protein
MKTWFAQYPFENISGDHLTYPSKSRLDTTDEFVANIAAKRVASGSVVPNIENPAVFKFPRRLDIVMNGIQTPILQGRDSNHVGEDIETK